MFEGIWFPVETVWLVEDERFVYVQLRLPDVFTVPSLLHLDELGNGLVPVTGPLVVLPFLVYV